jgi:hypothetical protein
MCSCSIIMCSITIYPNIIHRVEIDVDSGVEAREKEDVDEVEGQWSDTTVNNQDTMQDIVHFHMRHVCIFT